MMHDSRRLEVEAKHPGEKPTHEQLATINNIRAAGGCAFWFDDLATIYRELPL